MTSFVLLATLTRLLPQQHQWLTKVAVTSKAQTSSSSGAFKAQPAVGCFLAWWPRPWQVDLGSLRLSLWPTNNSCVSITTRIAQSLNTKMAKLDKVLKLAEGQTTWKYRFIEDFFFSLHASTNWVVWPQMERQAPLIPW